MKKLAQEGKFTYEAAFAIMGEAKKDELDKVVIKNDTLKKYFPRSYMCRHYDRNTLTLPRRLYGNTNRRFVLLPCYSFSAA